MMVNLTNFLLPLEAREEFEELLKGVSEREFGEDTGEFHPYYIPLGGKKNGPLIIQVFDMDLVMHEEFIATLVARVYEPLCARYSIPYAGCMSIGKASPDEYDISGLGTATSMH